MEKTITFSVIGSKIAIKQIEDRDFFIVNQIDLPDESPYRCNGIWKEEAIFDCGKESEDYSLRIPTNVLIKLLEHTKELTESDLTHWWSNQVNLHTTFKEIFRTEEVATLKNRIVELEEKLAAKKKK